MIKVSWLVLTTVAHVFGVAAVAAIAGCAPEHEGVQAGQGKTPVASPAKGARSRGSDPGAEQRPEPAADPELRERPQEALEDECRSMQWPSCVELADRLRIQRPPAFDRALSLYHSACEAKHAKGCAQLGLMYQGGLGVEREIDRARDLYRQACEAGGARGCSRLASLYLTGTGVERDLARALAYAQTGCETGDSRREGDG
jgi:hypothetical protein